MKRACVIGWPIEHSRSPLIHGYWLERYGIAGSYEKIAVTPDAAPDFIRRLEANGLVGCNVTVPLKEIAFAAVVERDASARAVGAVNTIWLENGRTLGANTDTYGFMTHLEQSAPKWRDADRPVVLIGAGGAARAVAFGFLEAGVGEVRVVNRTRARADELARQFGPRVKVFDWSRFDAATRGAGVIVNTTTIGMKGEGVLPVDWCTPAAGCIVADIVYVPLLTPLLVGARAAGFGTVDGLGMLLHQAVPGFEKWFGIRPEVTGELRARLVADIEGT
ncbi:MAG: shikimate dehydrogenase [Pseudomonadota bacterium]